MPTYDIDRDTALIIMEALPGVLPQPVCQSLDERLIDNKTTVNVWEVD